MKRSIKHLIISGILLLGFCLNVNVYAKTITPNEVPESTYIIGTHMFTRNVNEQTGYTGRLTTNLIMFASKTIESNDLSSMIIYYRLGSGKWINGLTGGSVTLPETFEINYTDLQLEEDNNTVKKPKNPILYLEGPKFIAYENDEFINAFKYQLTIFNDDIEDISNKVDGVEIIVTNNGQIENLDYKYGDKFGFVFPPLNVGDSGIESLIPGRRYHADYLEITNNYDGFVSIAVKAYALDGNGKKTYSDTVFVSINPDTNFPVPKVINNYSNPDYISEKDNNFNYKLGIEYPKAEVFTVHQTKFAYILQENTDGVNRDIGVFGLNKKAEITIPKNSIKTYTARLGYYDSESKFRYFTQEQIIGNEYVIDTRELTAPELKISPEADGGLYLRINSDFYENQDKNSLDYLIEGTEIYEIYYKDNVKKYKLLEGKFNFVHTSANDSSSYVARVYATNAAGKKVYSEFSEEITKNKYGEVTGDDVVDIGDSIKIWRYLEDLETLTEQEKINADVNGDGYIDYLDVKLIQSFDAYPNLFANTLPKKQITNYVLYGDTLVSGEVTTDSPEYFAVIERHLKGTDLLEGQALKNSDINGDGKVDGIDRALMFGYINEEVEFNLPSLTPITDYVLYGDINEDGEITADDRVKLSKYLNDEITLSMQAFANADVNGDGSINDDDYNLLNAYINLYSNDEIIYPLYKPELKYYQITYDLFDGKATNVDKYSIASGNITLKNPTKKGYTFTGWTGSNGTKPQKDLVIKLGTTGNLHYEANYEPITYTIKYHANSETAVGTMEDATFVYSDSDSLYYTVLESAFTNEGYKFNGWAVKPNATSNYMCPPIRLYKTEVADYANEENVVNLYAVWSKQ